MKNRLRKLRKETGKNIREMANILEVSKTTLSDYETGKTPPKSDFLERAAKQFNVSVDYILGRTDIKKQVPDNIIPIDNNDMVKIPIVGEIACGVPVLAEQNVIGYELVNKNTINGGTYFFLQAKGDSMIGARIHEGDLVLIRKQEDIENGEIGAVLIIEGCEAEATLKRVYKSDSQIVLQAENSKYPPIVKTAKDISSGNVKVLGKVIEVRFKFN
ncbi:LexA family protein [Orenia marismortui]|uniref:Repressor LexA n=1 Tax=Orenia marismortui TaxID=46469 RepID=A0A4R8GR46_9FIRM|nr:LexA family transcriptional regulator [Orenia marismortui]TDX48312.1 repressor LexA [Orenia marismortui]